MIPIGDPRHPEYQDWVDLDGSPQPAPGPDEFKDAPAPAGPYLIEDSYGDPRWSDGAAYSRHSQDGR